ncbi:MAG: DsrE family protein [Candidatus Nitrotoga sp.]
MKFVTQLLLALTLIVGGVASPAFAGDADPLFINLTTDNLHRATMGVYFGKEQFDRGHPLTIFLNDKGVLIGSKAKSAKFSVHHKVLTELINKGAAVHICSMCMSAYGVKEKDILPGIKISSPELTGTALFKDNSKSLTW